MSQKSQNAPGRNGAAPHYVSVCSQSYVVQLLAQHLAVRQLEPSPSVWHVLCMDQATRQVLNALAPEVRTTLIGDFEDGPLLACKAGRNEAEYCWTAKPRFLLSVLNAGAEVDQAVYLDADLFPFASLEALWRELSGADVLLFPQRFPERLSHMAERVGHYNAGMVGVRNTENARQALSWWTERCLEWCFYREEEGRLGDQKYLDSFASLFQGVRECRDEGINAAPWNIDRYSPVEQGGVVLLGPDTPLRLYHFHQYKLLGGEAYRAVSASVYDISSEVHRLIYGPYTKALNQALALTRSVAPGFAPAP
ncbi:MAG: hypothetical protein AB9900_01765 [Humidesulfovibrio sp.]